MKAFLTSTIMGLLMNSGQAELIGKHHKHSHNNNNYPINQEN